MALTGATLESLAEAYTKNTSYANPAVYMSLHTANPGGGGANEVTGGGYARQALTFAGSGGVDTVAAQTQFTVPGGNTVTWVGFWTALSGGTFTGGFPLISQPAVATMLSGSPTVQAPGHGRSVGDPVRLYTVPQIAGSAIPTGFVSDTTYYVVSVPSADTLTLSATKGGTAITPTSSGGFYFGFDGTLTFSSAGTATFPGATGITYAQT